MGASEILKLVGLCVQYAKCCFWLRETNVTVACADKKDDNCLFSVYIYIQCTHELENYLDEKFLWDKEWVRIMGR